MGEPIKDGAGKGTLAQVDTQHRLRVRGTTDSGLVDAAADGRLFAIATNIVKLTSGNHSHLIYLENLGDEDLHLTHVNLQFGVSDGTGDYQGTFTVGPTGGTLITAGATGIAGNLNSGSQETIIADIKIGSEGKTITGGGGITDLFSDTANRYLVPLDSRITKGNAVSFSMKPPTGNTDCDVAITLVFYKVNKVDGE